MAPLQYSRRALLQSGAVVVPAALGGCLGSGSDGIYAFSLDDGSERWVNQLGSVDGGPAVRNDTVYTGVEQTVYALSTGDGSERWSYDVDFEYTYQIQNPMPWKEMVLVPAGETLYALSISDGTEQWTFTADADAWLAPAVSDDTIVLGSEGDRIHGISAADGTQRWSYDVEVGGEDAVTVADSTVFVGSLDGRVLALDITDGSERWSFGTEEPVRGGPVVHRGTVYASTKGQRLFALSTAAGTDQWRWDAPPGGDISLGDSWPVFEALGKTIHVGSSGRLFTLTARDGDERWRVDYDLLSATFQAEGDTVYVAGDASGDTSHDGGGSSAVVKAFHRRDGHERWSSTLGSGFTETSPTIGDGIVCVGIGDGVLHALTVSDGSSQWTYDTGADLIHGPVIDAGTVYVGTTR